MLKKNTIAAIRLRKEMKEKSLTGASLAELANLPYYAVENILSGKSSKVEKLDAIAKALGKPVMYFIDPEYDSNNKKSSTAVYDAEIHYKVVKAVSNACKKRKIHLTKEKMDYLVNLTYPRIQKSDPEKLIIAQTEAIVNYAAKNDVKI